MKEIKAYVRRCCVNKLVTALEEAAAPGVTIVDIHPVGYGYEPKLF
jgi:nitrogen regulatory protein PII